MEVNKPKIISQKVDRGPDRSRASVTFIVEADSAADARDYVLSDEIMEKGIELCEQLPLMEVGLDERGVPLYCDKDGKPSDLMFVPEQDKSEKHYYKVTYAYIGSR